MRCLRVSLAGFEEDIHRYGRPSIRSGTDPGTLRVVGRWVPGGGASPAPNGWGLKPRGAAVRRGSRMLRCGPGGAKRVRRSRWRYEKPWQVRREGGIKSDVRIVRISPVKIRTVVTFRPAHRFLNDLER